MRRIVFFALLTVVVLPVATLLIFGIYQRSEIRSLQSKESSTFSDYVEIVGKPHIVEMDSAFSADEKHPISSLFRGNYPEDEGHRYYFWGFEGLPYYWLLVVTDTTEEVVYSELRLPP